MLLRNSNAWQPVTSAAGGAGGTPGHHVAPCLCMDCSIGVQVHR